MAEKNENNKDSQTGQVTHKKIKKKFLLNWTKYYESTNRSKNYALVFDNYPKRDLFHSEAILNRTCKRNKLKGCK